MRVQLQEKPKTNLQSLLFTHWFNNLWQTSFSRDFNTYNASNRLTSKTSGTTTWTYTYDNNGSLISKSDGTNPTTHTWDALNRLTATDLPGTTNDLSFAHNGSNERISKTVGSVTTQYLIDSNQPLPQVIQETTGTQTTSYLLGLDLIAQDNGTTRQYLLTDGIGSTRNLTDNTGASVKSINYDIFGSIRTQTGTSNTSFKYTGEQQDDESGLIFLRARYYDPEIGRFISKDPHPGYADVSQSLNLYVYVQNNPINFVDPSGLDKEEKETQYRTPAEQLQASLLGAIGYSSSLIAGRQEANLFKAAKEKMKELKKRFFEKSNEEREEAILTLSEDIVNLIILIIFQYPDPFGPWLPPSLNPLFPRIKEGDLIKL